MKQFFSIFVLIVLSGCTGIPKSIEPVKGFDIERYLGTWYEIARLDHSFERDLSNVTATYSMREDGGVRVINQGYSFEKNEWKKAEGKAYFVDEPTRGYLKVSFFGPFYGSYVVFELEEKGYQYAFISGPNTDYLWLLSRTSQVDSTVIQRFTTLAKSKGFDIEALIFVEHDQVKEDE